MPTLPRAERAQPGLRLKALVGTLPVLLAAGTLAAQTPSSGTVARLTVRATVVAVAPAQQSARLVRAMLLGWFPAARTPRRDGLVWVLLERPRDGVRRVTVNYLAN